MPYLKMTSFMENPFANFCQKLLITWFLMSVNIKKIRAPCQLLGSSSTMCKAPKLLYYINITKTYNKFSNWNENNYQINLFKGEKLHKYICFYFFTKCYLWFHNLVHPCDNINKHHEAVP